MKNDGTIDKINADVELYFKNKTAIYQEIIKESIDILLYSGVRAMVEYLDKFGITPPEEILKKYR